MYRWCSLATLLLGLVAGAWADYPGVGRPATQAELALWDSDIGPDLQRLPAARGSVLEGQAIYAAQCAACHGDDGRATEIFYALAGGVTAADVASRSGSAQFPTIPKISFSGVFSGKQSLFSCAKRSVLRAFPTDHRAL